MGNKAGKGASGEKSKKPKNDFTAEEKTNYMETYNLTESTVKEIKRDWDTWSNKGTMSRMSFIAHMKSTLMHLDNVFLGRVFQCFDTDNSGYDRCAYIVQLTVSNSDWKSQSKMLSNIPIDFVIPIIRTMSFDEYFECRGIILGGSIEEKLEASFRLFDKDGNGELDRDEIIKMLEMATFSLVRKALILKLGADVAMKIPVELDDEAIQETKNLATKIFAAADKDNSGTINYEEFKEGFEKDPSIMGFFKQF